MLGGLCVGRDRLSNCMAVEGGRGCAGGGGLFCGDLRCWLLAEAWFEL